MGTATQPWIERCAGVLLHPTSLPQGRLGADAGRFAALAAAAGLRVWQMLPVGTVDALGSPYRPDSGFAGHPGLLPQADPPSPASVAEYVEVNADWLPDYALFAALEAQYPDRQWQDWPAPLRARDPAALQAARRDLAAQIAAIQSQQCAFDRAWRSFKRDCNDAGVLLFGDVPLFVAHHSADVWSHRGLFEVADDGRLEASLGVPPDAFSDQGQWWGYPPYHWDAMAAEDYRWWRRRFEVQAQRFDLIRIDHFRGLAAFWRIPADAPSARDGSWTPGPGRAAIDALDPILHDARLVAEDLGYITDDVVALRHALKLPGMRVLQFAFDGDPRNPHLPAQYEADTVCYTGTHDNDTTLGWWQGLDAAHRRQVCATLGAEDPQMPEALLEFAWASPAPLTVAPLQDLLGLGSQARMNRPGTTTGNWRWRFDWEQVPGDFAARLRETLAHHGRIAGSGT